MSGAEHKHTAARAAEDRARTSATHTAEVFEQAQVEDHLVDNENCPATVVAEEVLHRVEWLHRAGAQGTCDSRLVLCSLP